LTIERAARANTHSQDHPAPYLERVLALEGRTTMAEAQVAIAPGASRQVEWIWARSGTVLGFWMMTVNPAPVPPKTAVELTDLAGMSVQIEIETIPVGTASESANNVPWDQLQQQGRYYDPMPLDMDVEAQQNNWVVTITNNNAHSIVPVFFWWFQAKPGADEVYT